MAWILFLVVIVSSAASPGSPLLFNPEKLLINGTLGSDVFQASINVTARYCDVTDLNFTPSNLQITVINTPWAPQFLISSADIQINPNIKNIAKGKTNEYLIRVQNVPRSGRYNGSFSLSYKLPDGTVETEAFPISLMAYKFNASPIFLNFDKDNPLRSIFGESSQSRDIRVKDESGQISQNAMNYLQSNLCATLNEMVNVDDKSCRFDKQNCFQIEKPLESKNGNSNNSVILHAKFKNPEEAAGKYTGVLSINSKNPLWPIVNIPVEMRIRLMPGWLAFILIFIGVFIYYIITYRKKDVKDRRLREHEIKKLMRNITITRDCNKKYLNMINIEIKGFNKEKISDFDEKKEIINVLDDAMMELKGNIQFHSEKINTNIFQNPLKWNDSWNELDETWNEIEEAHRNVEHAIKKAHQNVERKIEEEHRNEAQGLSKSKLAIESGVKIPTESLEVIPKSLLYSKMKRTRDLIFAIISILLATFIGYSQLYANNPIFGAGHSPVYEYLALLLWGFSVEAGAAKVTDIFDLFGLSRGSNQN